MITDLFYCLASFLIPLLIVVDDGAISHPYNKLAAKIKIKLPESRGYTK